MRDATSNTGFLETPVISIGRRTLDNGRGAGLRFYGVNGDRFRMVAAVAFADIGGIHRLRKSSATRVGVVRGSVIIALWWASQTGRGLYYALFRRGQAASPGATVSAPSESSPA